MSNDILKADLVFEGGGVKGIGFVGALSVGEEKGYTWADTAGTSAGAILAALVAAGYTSQELRKIMTELDYKKFIDPTFFSRLALPGKVISVLATKGIYKGDWFEDWLSQLLAAKGVRTFGNLVDKEWAESLQYRYKLRVIASDISNGRLLELPQGIKDYGILPDDLNVAAAVRMSMSIPFFFKPAKIKDMKNNLDCCIVDGGLLSNFPVWLFDYNGDPGDYPTFGLKLVEPDEGVPHRITSPVSLGMAMFSTMFSAYDRKHIDDKDFMRTIPIPTLGVGTTDFNLSKERSEALYQSGRQSAEKFFNTWDFDVYKQKLAKLSAVPSRRERLWK
jgi:NTE family protein